jgi:GTP-binding protein HflX
VVADPIVEQRFRIPQSKGVILAALGAGALIRDRRFDGDNVVMTVSGPASLLGRYRDYRRK